MGNPNIATRTQGVIVSFDAVILERTEQPACDITLFARYWVTSDSYRLAVSWGEPHGRGLNFPIYPTTLRLSQDKKIFTVEHDVLPWAQSHWERPVILPTSFTNMYGDYHLDDLRFAALKSARFDPQELRATIYGAVHSPSQSTVRVNSVAGVSEILIRQSGKSISDLHFLDNEHHELRGISNFYAKAGRTTVLRRQIITNSSTPIIGKLPGEGVTVRTRHATNRITAIPLLDLRGGRLMTIEYTNLIICDQLVPMASSITVYTGNQLVRSASLYNFKSSQESSSETELDSALYGGFGQEESEYRTLLQRYWGKSTNELVEADRRSVRRLLTYYNNTSSASESLGPLLRHLNIVMELARMLGDADLLVLTYRTYLATLRKAHLFDTLLVGGQTAIGTLVLWGRFDQAMVLLREWIDQCSTIDGASIIKFIDRELQRGNIVTTLKLMNAVTANDGNDSFEFIALRCIALKQGLILLQKTQEPGTFADSEQKFIRYSKVPITTDEYAIALKKAEASFSKIESPSDRERLLYRLRLNEPSGS
jgi:hypothetical protein